MKRRAGTCLGAPSTVADNLQQGQPCFREPSHNIGDRTNGWASATHPVATCGGGLTEDGPSASGHAYTASTATGYGGATVSAAPGKWWWFEWCAQGVEGIKAKTRCHGIGWRWTVRGGLDGRRRSVLRWPTVGKRQIEARHSTTAAVGGLGA